MMMRAVVHRLSIGLALGLGAAVLAWQSFSGDPTPDADAGRRLQELRVTLGVSRKLVTTAGMSAADQAGFDRSGNFLKPHLLVLTLPVPIEFDGSLETVTRLRGEPTFLLQELEEITGDGSFAVQLDPAWRSERRFDLAA
jgi:hypothetical protein